MKINKIILNNWQIHSKLELDFNDNLNVITGRSSSGKSCIRRAIDWVCFNPNISEDDYRKENTDETSVIIILDNGFEIERVRSNTLNRYILRKKDCEDKIYDSFGKVIPDDIQNILEVKPIEIEKESLNLNIHNQISLPFLIDKPASFRAKLFNKLTGNELLDKLFKFLNKENLRINKDIKSIDADIIEQEKDIIIYTKNHEALNEKLQNIKVVFAKINNDVEYYKELKNLAERKRNNINNSKDLQDKLNKIVILSDTTIKEIKDKITLFNNLEDINNKLSKINNELIYVEDKKEEIIVPKICFNSIKLENDRLIALNKCNRQLITIIEDIKDINIKEIPNINLSKLKKDNEKLEKLYSLFVKTETIKANIESSIELESKCNKKIIEAEKELKEVWKNIDVCPICKQKVCK